MNNDYKVKIAVNKSLLKEFQVDSQRTVYMKNSSEFQIQIFNPYTYTIGVSISLDGKEMQNMLVLKPGQRVWLERYLNEARKFLFETYEVNDSQSVRNAIAKNGEIEVKFYKEKEKNQPILIKGYDNYQQETYWRQPINTKLFNHGVDELGLNTCTSFGNASLSSNSEHNYYCGTVTGNNSNFEFTTCSATLSVPKVRSKSIETGRVEKGSYSNQQFKTVYNDFESFSFDREVIKILPESRKPIHANDLNKIYCTNCGRKLNQKFNYCPYCGHNINY